MFYIKGFSEILRILRITAQENAVFPIAMTLKLKDIQQPDYHCHSESIFWNYSLGLTFLSSYK